MDIRDLISSTSISLLNPEITRTIIDQLFSSVALNFNMQPQTQSNWCWAATATSVSHFYWTWSPWTQCSVANGELGRNDCCSSAVPAPCNVPWYLDRALTRTSNLVSVSGPVDFQTVRTEIQAGRPVGARIGWAGGGGHFMAIYGCGLRAGVEYFDIDDPIYGKSSPTVDTFTNSYQGSGSWTTTYFTKKAIVIKIRPYLIPEVILKRIWEARPSLDLLQTASAETAAVQLGLAHPVYSARLDELRGSRLPQQPASIRVMELKGETPQAYFDVDPGTQGQVRTVAGSNAYLDLFPRGLQALLKATEQKEGEAEIRLLQIPSLYVDALWLHYDDLGSDVLLPIRAPFGPEAFKPYSIQQFVEIMSAKAREHHDGDDLIAP